MNLPFDYTLFLFIAPILVVGETFTLIRLYELRSVYQARVLFFCVILGFVWLNSDVLRIILVDEFEQYSFALLSHFTILLISPVLVLLTLSFIDDQDRMPSKWYLLLFLPSAVLGAFLFTNPHHHLYFARTFPMRVGEFSVIGLEYGPLFWITVAISFIYVAWCLFKFSNMLLTKLTSINRKNVTLFLFAIVIPFISESLYLAGIIEGWDKDLAPLFYGLSILVFHIAFRPKYHEKVRS